MVHTSIFIVIVHHRPYYIVTCSSDNSIRIWTIDSGKCVQVMYNTEETQLTSLTVCDNGKVITGTDSGLVKIMIIMIIDKAILLCKLYVFSSFYHIHTGL